MALLRNSSNIFIKALHDEVDACGIAASEWTTSMMQLIQQPLPEQSNTIDPASLMKELSKIVKDEMLLSKRVIDESTILYTAHNICLYEIHKLAALAYERKCGNCGEQASLALVYLLKLNITPIELFEIENGDHCFVVIGRPQNSDPRNIKSWNNAVICDPWNNFYCYARDITNEQENQLLRNTPNAYPKLYIRLDTAIYRDAMNKKTDKPQIVLTLRDVYKKLIELTLHLNAPNSRAYVSALSEKADIENKSAAIYQLNSVNRLTDVDAQNHDRKLRAIAKTSIRDAHTFFTTITRTPTLKPALQDEIKAFRFRR